MLHQFLLELLDDTICAAFEERDCVQEGGGELSTG
jgi:hypothetical protein